MGLTRRETLLSGICLIFPRSDEDLKRQALDALKRSITFFRENVGFRGGFVWRYSHDLEKREGEGAAAESTAWVQPPGTPTVGTAFLHAFRTTDDPYFLDAAVESAHALVSGQLESGGWTYRIDFDPDIRKRQAYRSNRAGKQGRNVSTLDDDTTQAALRFLIETDSALKHQDAIISEAVRYGLDRLLKAQLPSGAWPQGFDSAADTTKFPARSGSYPRSWSRTFQKTDYWTLHTLNDGNLDRMADTLFLAEKVYGTGKYHASARRIGEFLVMSQMPDPQPAWAQQYNAEMEPSWARKFEPPAITGGESQGALRTLLALYTRFRERRFLEPIPRALEYLRGSRLPDGRLARFYELRTNRPLYFNKAYELTYKDDDLPTHYAFKVKDGTDAIQNSYNRIKAVPPSEAEHEPVKPAPIPAEVRKVIGAMDARGAFVEVGRLRFHGNDDPTRRIIDSGTFARNVEILSAFLAPSK